MGRLGFGPVFAWEWQRAARRWQIYAARAVFGAALLAALSVVWWVQVDGRRELSIREQAAFGIWCYHAVVGMQLALVMLVAPTATAGALCAERASGALDLVLTTDLSSSEIVLGKLAARLAPVLGLMACGLPVLALGGLMGGIDFEALAGAELVAVGVAVLGCALALTLSLWAARVYEALMATYAVWILALLGRSMWSGLMTYGPFGGWLGPMPDWTWRLDPFWLSFGPYLQPGSVDRADHVRFLLACSVLSAVLVAITTWRLRSVVARGPRRSRRWLRFAWDEGHRELYWPGPSLDDNPALWRAWRRRPSGWARALWWLYLALAVGFSLMAIDQGLRATPRTFGGNVVFVILTNAFQASTGLLLAGISAATVVGEERVRGTLDLLLTTRLSTPEIVWGQWRGALRAVVPPTVLAGVLAGALAVNSGLWVAAAMVVGLMLAHGVAITSLGVALSVWIRRPGQAAALTVAAYLLVTIGWIFAVVSVLERSGGPVREVMEGLVIASPFMGVGLGTEWTFRDSWDGHLGYQIIWMFAFASAGLALLLATLATFDRALGRMPDVPPRAGQGSLRGSGWRIPSAAGRRGADAASCAPRPR